MTLDELKAQVARSASPKVNVDNVSIAFSDSIEPYLAGDKPVNLPKPDESGNPWWLTVALVVILLTAGYTFLSKKLKEKAEKQQEEVEALRKKAADQEKQLNDVNLKASQLIEKQQQMAQGLLEQQALSQQFVQQITNQQQAPAPAIQQQAPSQAVEELQDVLDDVSTDLSSANVDELGDQVKSWLEKA